MAIDIGTGTTIAFPGFSFKVTGVKHSGVSRPSIKTSHLATVGFDEFMPGDLVDPGMLELEIQYDPALTPPIDGEIQDCTITFPEGEEKSGQAFLTDFDADVPLEDLMTGTCKFKCTGEWDF